MKKPILKTLSGNPIEKQLVFNFLPIENGAKGVLAHIENSINVSTEGKTVFNIIINVELPSHMDNIISANLRVWDDVKTLTWGGIRIFPREEF